MLVTNLISECKYRSLIAQITNEKDLIKLIKDNNISLYCGFDITADSLHIGHIIPLLLLNRFQRLGHQPIVLIGGATSLIGDPSFKLSERRMNSVDLIKYWESKLTHQFSLFLDFSKQTHSAKMLNNYEWFRKINILNFLRDIGKCFSINKMITKDSVKQRINRIDRGISFTEFSYSLLQAYDFLYLYKKFRVVLQIGGSDQWGNIISGIDLIRRLYKTEVFGLTIPLLTKNNGIKFGKTEKNTIWLNKKKTSPYKFYQYWINTPDENVYKFLKIFTLLNIKEIEDIEKEIKYINDAKHILAQSITTLVHGYHETKAVQRITNSLFGGNFSKLKEVDLDHLKQDGIPSIELKNWNKDLRQILVDTGLALSRSQATNMILSKSIRINNIVQDNSKYFFVDQDRIFGKYTLISRGKKNFYLVHWML